MKILKKILVLFLLCVILLQSIVQAVTQERAGEAIASAALDSVLNHQSDFVYSYGDDSSLRAKRTSLAKKRIKTSGTAYATSRYGIPRRAAFTFTNKYALDCGGFCDVMLYWGAGITRKDLTTVGSATGVSSNLKAGDMIHFDGHYAIYVGNYQGKNYIAHCVDNTASGEAGFKRASPSNWTIRKDVASSYKKFRLGYSFARIKESVAEKLTEEDLYDIYIEGTNDGTIASTVGTEKFKYFGIPQSGYYGGTIKIDLKWLISKFAEILDWLVGFMIYSVKMCFVGWITICEALLTNAIQSAVGEATLNFGNLFNFVRDSSKNITIENIVFNRVPLFDINFFNYKIDDSVDGTGRTKENTVSTNTVSNAIP